jgi:hypothetical protein
MSKLVLSVLTGAVLAISAAGTVLAQNTRTTTTTTVQKTVQNADGSWSVVEYPAGKQVTVDLMPTALVPGATGRATVIRDGDNTKIKLDVSGMNADVSNLNLYAVDPSGNATLLGPVGVNGGVATFSTTTPMNRFMLVLSPDPNLTKFGPDVHVALRSSVPQGLTVVPMLQSASGENVSTVVSTTYSSMPVLDIGSFPANKESEVHLKFRDSSAVKRATIFVTPNYDHKGVTRVKAKFHELTKAPEDAFLTLWAVSSDGTYSRLGSVRNSGGPNVAEIDTERNHTNLPMGSFGLFMTVEPTEVIERPSGPVIVNVVP